MFRHHKQIFFIYSFSINTSCNVNSSDKSYFSNYSKVFSKPITTNNSSYKTEDLLPFGDEALSDGPVDSSCIYKSKYDVTTYREKTQRHNKVLGKCRFNKKCIYV